MLKILLFFSFQVPFAFCAAPSPRLADAVQQIEGFAQGTSYHIHYTGAEKVGLKTRVDQNLESFDKIFSNYRPDSEISRFNADTTSTWFPVSSELVFLVELAHTISDRSHGAFDISIGALVKLWGFGPFKRKDPRIPSEAEILAAKKNVDYHQLLFQAHPPALKKTNPNLSIDLSGIAQGLSVDRLCELLDAQGIKNYMVEIGGEIKTRGQKELGRDWELAIESPNLEPSELMKKVHAPAKGLTSAGDYREYFEKDGKRYSHTIDPRSGRPIMHNLASVTVIADTAAEADGWDTAIMVLGPEESRKLAEQWQLSAFMIRRTAGQFTTESIGDFDKYLVKAKSNHP